MFMEEKNPTPINFMYLNSDWEQEQKEVSARIENVAEILDVLLNLI